MCSDFMRQKPRRFLRLANVRLLLVCVLWANVLSMTTLSAQDGGPVKITSDVRVVEVDVTVRDAQGKPVQGLQAKDFTILDNGKPRPFTIFNSNGGASDTSSSIGQPSSPVSSTPRPPLPPNTFTNARVTAPPADGHSTILLLDGVNGWFDTFAHGAQGIEGLMAKVPPDEKIAVYAVAKDLGLLVLQDYTTDRQRLKEKVGSFIPRGMKPAPPGMGLRGDGGGMINSAAELGPSHRLAAGPPNPRAAPPVPSPFQTSPQEQAFYMRRATEDLRLSLNALAAKLSKLPGRKSVFWITEGFPPVQLRNMDAAWDSTIAALNDANIQINTVDADGLGGPDRLWGLGGILAQQQIADRTGGTAYFHRNDLDAAMASGIADARSSYTLGFYLTQIDGTYHELKVRVDRPGVQLNHRQGYYAQSEAVADLIGKKVDLEAALLSPVDSTGVGITASFNVASASPHNTLNAHLKLDPESLSMVRSGEGWAGQIEEMFVEFNEAGDQVGRQSDKKRFEITAAQKPKFDSTGVTLMLTVSMTAGAVRLRIIVRDTASGRTGSLTVPLDQVSQWDASGPAGHPPEQ
jgi:VWFA-related protein